MSWLFGQADAHPGARLAAGRPQEQPALLESTQPLNRWEQDYLRAAGPTDFSGDDIETGHSARGGPDAAPDAAASAAAYHRQRSSPDWAPGSTATGGQSLAELARSVSDANVYYSQRPPSRPLPMAPETSPWVDSDAGGAMRLRQGDGADPQADPLLRVPPQDSLWPVASPTHVRAAHAPPKSICTDVVMSACFVQLHGETTVLRYLTV